MVFKCKTNMSVAIVSSLLLTELSYANVRDSYQHSGSNNISYDLPSKFYMGVNLNGGLLTDHTMTVEGNSTTLNGKGFPSGLFGGYKFNEYISVEANVERLGELKTKENSFDPIFTSNESAYQFSLNNILSYPFQSNYQYTLSVYGKVGCGMNWIDYHYNLGLGLNVDLRSNFSGRIGYAYYQNYYVFGNQAAHLVSLDLYYNFS